VERSARFYGFFPERGDEGNVRTFLLLLFSQIQGAILRVSCPEPHNSLYFILTEERETDIGLFSLRVKVLRNR
jgi:hypothetical protein